MSMTDSNWLFVSLFIAIALVFPAVPVVAARILGPHRPNALKNETFECGMQTVGDSWVQFKIQYYIFGLLFLVFDVESIFLFPWAVAYQQMALFAVFEGLIFILLLTGGLVYLWRKGALEWV